MTINDVGRQIDALGLFLTGGASNIDPTASLGGTISSSRVRSLGPLVSTPVPAIRVDHAFPGNGVGDAILTIDANGDLVLTPPGAAAGTPVAVAAGETKIIYGLDRDKAVRVFREPGLNYAGSGTLDLNKVINGGLSHDNVSDAQRIAGVTTYRGLVFQAQGPFGVLTIRLWMPPVGGAQAVYSLGTEVAPGGVIQTIADEFTAPAAVVFSTPTVEGSALTILSIDARDFLGLWIRRVFPAAGAVAVEEDFQLAMKYEGA